MVKSRMLLLVLGLLAWPASAMQASEFDQKAIDRAHDFLKTTKQGKDVLSYVHFGATYNRHTYTETRFVTAEGKRLPGRFALVYTFVWESDGKTDVAFLCDPRGNVYQVQIMKTNAVLSQPFVLAKASIQIVGNVLLAALGDNMSREEKAVVENLVQEADPKGILEWSLKFQQALGR